MENQAGDGCEDVRKSGYLRKQKSMHRRYFVLRAASERGPARLEYYESEKKFRGKAPVPKKAVALETCFNINKRADAKNKHMIVLYTRAESFALAAENEEDQDDWFQAMVELQCKSKCTRTHARTHGRVQARCTPCTRLLAWEQKRGSVCTTSHFLLSAALSVFLSFFFCIFSSVYLFFSSF